MNDSYKTSHKLPTPQFKTLGPIVIAGLTVPMRDDAATALPQLWQQFVPYLGRLSQQVKPEGYGVCIRPDTSTWDFYYMAGCAVWDTQDLPSELKSITLPTQDYAIFTHNGHVSELHQAISAIFDTWLPTSNFNHAVREKNSVHFVEFYGAEFNGETGMGGMEVWLPVIKK